MANIPTGPGTCDWKIGNAYPSDGWRYHLLLFARATQRGEDGQAHFDQAIAYADRVISLIDPARTGPGLSFETISQYEKAISSFEICGSEGRAALGLPALGGELGARWRPLLVQKAAALAAGYGESFIDRLPMENPIGYPTTIAASPILRAAMQAHAPAQMAAIDAAIANTPEGRQRAAMAAARDAQAHSASLRAAARAALPARAGAWRKTGPTTYSRSAAHNSSAELSCGEFGGLVLRVTLPQGSYFASERNVEMPNQSAPLTVNAYATVNGSERRFDAFLWSEQAGTTTYYNNRIVILPIQSSRAMAEAVSGGMNSLAGAIDQATGVPREDNASSQLLAIMAPFFRLGIEGSRYRSLEIDDVRNLASLPVSVDAASPNVRIQLFDLAPTSAPFRNLMEACWS